MDKGAFFFKVKLDVVREAWITVVESVTVTEMGSRGVVTKGECWKSHSRNDGGRFSLNNWNFGSGNCRCYWNFGSHWQMVSSCSIAFLVRFVVDGECLTISGVAV